MDVRGKAVGRIAKLAVWWVLGALIFAILGAYFGSALVRKVYPPYVAVEGISMKPLLHVGDLVMLTHATVHKLQKGDIIAFQTTKTVQQKYDVPSHFVHQISKVVHEPDGQLKFETKGIHNPGPDGFLTPANMVIGRYAGDIPYAGYVVLFVQSTEGMILGGAIALIIVIYVALGHLDERKAEREQITVDFAEALNEMRGMVGEVVQAVTPARAPHGPPSFRTETGIPSPDVTPVPTVVPGVRREGPHREAPGGTPVSGDRLEALIGAVNEYGEHLRSHTAVMRHLAATTSQLEAATEGLLHATVKTGGADRQDLSAALGELSRVPDGSLAAVQMLLDRTSQMLRTLSRPSSLVEERAAELELTGATSPDAAPPRARTEPSQARPVPARALMTPLAATECRRPVTPRALMTPAVAQVASPTVPAVWHVEPRRVRRAGASGE